jgi:Predicted signal transduction protein containing EAL and modified HD-GYP domains
MLDVPMKDALSEIALTDDVRNALINNSGELVQVIELISCYEKGIWEKVRVITHEISINDEKLAQGYLKSLKHVDEIMDFFS